MRLLVLGGTHHVGRAVVETALAGGWDVTTLNRGLSGPSAPGTDELHADRTDAAASPPSPNSRNAASISSVRRSARRSVSGTPAQRVGVDICTA